MYGFILKWITFIKNFITHAQQNYLIQKESR